MTLVRNLFPIFKAFFLIAYSFFFVFSIFGITLFSYAASPDGIAFYPTKTQYVDYFATRAASEYPNGNNPGNFGCNETDVLGTQGLCGQAGPQSPLPHWSTTDSSAAAAQALDAAFIVGSGLDARVGGCFNLIGAADTRVLPCYCYYSAEKMNRTTSCDWLNAAWYKTELGQVRCRVAREGGSRSLPKRTEI
jgi:hypothetical protein